MVGSRLPSQLGEAEMFAKRARERAFELTDIEWNGCLISGGSAARNGVCPILDIGFVAREEEEIVPDDWATQRSAILIARELRLFLIPATDERTDRDQAF